MTEAIKESYERLLAWIEANDRAGWDPYDGLNTGHRLLTCVKPARLGSQYLHKFSPVNLRPLFGVKKSRQLQAAAFIGLALLRYPGCRERTGFTEGIAGEMKASTMKSRYGHHCWESHGFPIQMRNAYRPVGTPDIVGNEACGRFLYEYSLRRKDPQAREMALGLRDYIITRLYVSGKEMDFFKYKPITPDWCCTYNASLLAAQYVMDIDAAENDDSHTEIIENAFRSVCSMQKPEGYWCYSINFRSGKEKHQVDYHQGFILDCLLRFMEVYGFDEPFLSAYNKGIEFYRKEQFTEDGQALYRWPKKWPLNVQNQAQGILTFTRASAMEPEYLEFARRIAERTIDEFQDRRGYFYYQKHRWFMNRISYIRWSDAAMVIALAVLLEHLEVSVEEASAEWMTKAAH